MGVGSNLSERLYLMAGVLSAVGLALAFAGVTPAAAVGILVASAVLLAAGFALQTGPYLRPRAGEGGFRTEAAPAAGNGHRRGLPVPRGGWLGLTAVATLGALVIYVGGLLPGPASSPGVREFTVQATKFAYSPGVMQVNKGDRVILRLTPRDVKHGIYVDGYGLEAEAEPRKEATLEFVANKAGKFHIRCSVTCGPLHPFMIGELVVQPNSPFYGAAGLALLVGAGTVAYLWRQRGGDRGLDR